ncbi:MAG: transcription repressor NadR [Eubacteriales bacterium]|nr:transcription repressor NadR [Eubacteriales bacterium]
MDSNKRRENIIKILRSAAAPVSAGKLAAQFDVSRQIIVGDIALIRASGIDINATPKGYVMPGSALPAKKQSRIVCIHDNSRTEDELNIIVDNGCRILDVIVEHPIYGQLTGILDIGSRYDVQNFLRLSRESEAHSLNELTDGIHIHTIEYTDDEAFERTVKELDAAGFLYK